MKKAELMFVPAPAMGHLISAVQLAKLLLDLNANLSITILTVKPQQDTKISAYIDSLTATATATDSIQFIDLSQSYLEADVFKFLNNLAQTIGPLVKEVVTNMIEHSNSVPNSPRLAGFVLDSLLTCLIELANEFGVPSYAFYTSGAGSLGFHHYTQALHDEEKIEFGELKDSDTKFTVPSYVNPVSIKLFPSVMFQPESFTLFSNLIKGIREVKGVLINTFSELESHAVDSFSNGKLQVPPIYPVGPILNLEGSSNVHHNYDSIMQWLDEQPPSSVVFLCFGSDGSFDTNQVKEIAYALEQSGHRFLWSLRRPGKQVINMARSSTDYENVEEILPKGFLDRTAETGKIIGWAPQVAILGHPAVGGFVSHCGWNSMLESIWFGVPMMAWPLYSEQQLNALTLVRESGLAVELKMDYKIDDGGVEIIKAKEIERGIKLLMGHDSDVRDRMKKMSDKSRKTLMDGGSSHAMLYRFISDIITNMS
ncbi:UDP-glucose flavonoid 3-O-glucosyltransferase 6 [Hibiscus syriacus]|uniref:Glycosyltransferase n=1 Tax=Hibiscus syriacus TaxID=106335 RepID=A0A6A2ZEJ5_HIBSY|nr:anthocyanidin 3-O-glucosyltransferase 6-like [Hibiscus syriacus]KAE8690107.1 UDP-glucose flavonoid 3-O-glucosyltransferase 6 [Hibiscus syriacus]